MSKPVQENTNQLFLIQFIVILFEECLGTAGPIFYKSFPVFKRFTSVGIVRAVSRALMYVITSFGFIYLTDHFGHWGLWVVMIPIIIGFLTDYFILKSWQKSVAIYLLLLETRLLIPKKTIIRVNYE